MEEKNGEVHSSKRDEFLIVESKKYPEEVKGNYDSKTDSYFDGKLLELWAHIFLKIFITTFTAGILAPFAKCIYKKYIYSHTVYNGKRLKFEGEPVDLFVNYFRWNFFRVITFGIYSFWIPARYKEWELSHVHFEDEPLVKGDSYFTGTVGGYFGINLLTWFIKIASFGLLLPLAQIIKLRWELKHCVINRKRIIFRGSAVNFILKKIGWMLLSGITFGIYGLWVPIKTIRWEVSNTGIMKKNEEKVVEEKSKKSKTILFVILGVIAVIVIAIIIAIVTFFKPSNIEDEKYIESTSDRFYEEFAKDKYNEIGFKQIDKEKINIKELNSSIITEFINNKGKGQYYNYYSHNSNDRSVHFILRKNNTVCEIFLDYYIDDYNEVQNYKDIECKSKSEYFFESIS